MSDNYINNLITKDKVLMPYEDETTVDRFGKPSARCARCHYILTQHIEQFCPSCGQRLVEDKNDEFYEERNDLNVK